jgi:putative oxidoreductase
MANVAASMAVPATRSRARYWRPILLLLRISLGCVFLYAAYTKLHIAGAWHLRDYYFIFAFGISSYEMLSPDNVLLLAKVLPWVEVVLGALLVSGLWLRWIGSITTGLLIVFMYALSRAAIKGLAINCGCFGNSSTTPGKELMVDSLLILAAIAVTVGAFVYRRRNAAWLN